MAELLLWLLALALLLSTIPAATFAVRVLVGGRRRRQGCGHTRYRGRAGVLCLECHRERHRIAAHVELASGGKR
jgi:hypothetical protein